MKIKIVDKRKKKELQITKEELKTLHGHFLSYNIQVDDKTALSIIDERIYNDINLWGIHDTEVREELGERISKLLLGKYRAQYQGFPQNDWRKSIDEVVIVAELNGFSKNMNSQKKEDQIPQKFREEIEKIYKAQEKDNFEYDPRKSPGMVMIGGMGSGLSITDPNNLKHKKYFNKDY